MIKKLFPQIRFQEARGLEALFLYSLAYYVLTLPWQLVSLPTTLGIMLAGFFWLLLGDFKLKLKALRSNWWAALFFAYYLILVLSAFYSPAPNEAIKEIFAKMPLLVWPLLLAAGPRLSKASLRWLLKAFVLSTALAMLYSFGESFYRYFQDSDARVFYFSELLAVGRVPPHYMGMYASFAYGLVLYYWLKGEALWQRPWINLSFLLLLSLSIVFIWVRMQYLIFGLINLLLFGQAFFLRSRAKGWAVTLLLFVLFFGLLASFPATRSRLVDTYHEWRSRDEMVEDKQTNPRVFLWAAAWELIEENFWLGIGTGAENEALNRELKKVDAPFWDGYTHYQLYEMRYNVHNSFLQHWLANGFVQFLIFSSLFIAPAFAFKNHAFRGGTAIFLGVSGLSFLTESMLQRQAGLLFFSFFYALFFVAQLGFPQERAAEKGEDKIDQ